MMERQAADWRILSVDLGKGQLRLSEDYIGFWGGRGENYARLLQMGAHRALTKETGTVLLWAAGPLVGTGFPGASRINLAARSPVTQGIGSSSAGGNFAPTMRFAGFDQLIITGQAPAPVYLVLEEGKAFIKDARPIWGHTVAQSVAWLQKQEGTNLSVAVIGPAGERGVAASCVLFDGGRAAGRCALGAIMGVKRLKAVVVKGKGYVKVADPKRFKQVVHRVLTWIDRSETLRRIGRFGTIQASPAAVEPIRNFQAGVVPHELRERINYEAFSPYFVKQYGCPGCPVRCGRRYRIEAGQFAGKGTNGLHANSITDFGTRLGIFDPEAIIAAHGLCNELGLDIDNASGVIAWAMEAFQRGLLTTKDTEGLELTWGNADVVLTLLTQVAYRRGIGELLAEGCQKAAAALGGGSEEFCIAVKGQELEEALRPWKAWALGVVVAERGGTHTRGAPVIELAGQIPAEIAVRAGLPPKPLPAASYEGKPEVVVYYERLHSVLYSLGVCYFISDWMDPVLPSFPDFSEALSAAVGRDVAPQELVSSGEKIHTLGKLLNIAYAGFTRDDDYPPRRLMDVPIETGELLHKEEWDQMLDRYYSLHGWDLRTGWPLPQRLHDLELESYEWVLRMRDRGLSGNLKDAYEGGE